MNLKELAALLGLSQTTVSRALNGYSDVSERTRARIMAAAREHSYAPSPDARSLATGRAMAIGLVIPIGSRHERVNPIFGDFVAGAGDVLSARNYDIMLSLTSDADESSSYTSVAIHGRVDGLIIQAPLTGDWRGKVLKELGIPYVVHGRFSDEDGSYSWVDMDNRRAFHRATQHLLDQGHTRIALLNGVAGMDFAKRREDGFRDALLERDHDPLPDLIFNAPMTETFGFEATSTLLESGAPPTAIITSSILVAIGARRAVELRSFVLGRDVSIVTHDDVLTYLPNSGAPPVFSATRSSVRKHGELASDMLLGLIDDPKSGPRQTLLDAEFICGLSSGPAPDHPITRGRPNAPERHIS